MPATGHCAAHPEYTSSCLSCYLSQPCDDRDCARTATESGVGVRTERHGKWCSTHVNYSKYTHAMND